MHIQLCISLLLIVMALFCALTHLTRQVPSSDTDNHALCTDNARAVAAANATSLATSIKVAVAKAQASATASNGELPTQKHCLAAAMLQSQLMTTCFSKSSKHNACANGIISQSPAALDGGVAVMAAACVKMPLAQCQSKQTKPQTCK